MSKENPHYPDPEIKEQVPEQDWISYNNDDECDNKPCNALTSSCKLVSNYTCPLTPRNGRSVTSARTATFRHDPGQLLNVRWCRRKINELVITIIKLSNHPCNHH